MFVNQKRWQKRSSEIRQGHCASSKTRLWIDEHVEPFIVAQKRLKEFMRSTSSVLDTSQLRLPAHLPTNPDYASLASRIAVSNCTRTQRSLSAKRWGSLYYIDPKTSKKAPLLADDVFHITGKTVSAWFSNIYDRDFGYDYFGFKTLEKSYLLQINGQVAERPQHMPCV